MRNRSGQLPHRSNAAYPRKLRLCRPVTLFAFAHSSFRLLLIGQIEHEGDSLVPTSFEDRATDQYWDAAAVFPKILFLVWLAGSGDDQFLHTARELVFTFRSGPVPPASQTLKEIRPDVS